VESYHKHHGGTLNGLLTVDLSINVLMGGL
jgi:hypothetical protein